MKKFNKLLCFMVVFVAVMAAFCMASFTATVGEQLTTPETGWARINDNDSLITYTNFNHVHTNSGSINYGGDLSYSTLSYAKISFSFYGSKIRVIGQMNVLSERTASGLVITIDGIQYYYTEIGPKWIPEILEFELNGLSKGSHSVTISRKTEDKGCITFDAIDIDDTGYLIDINQTVNAPNNFISTSGNSKVDLTWTATTTIGSAVYNIKRSLTSGGIYEIIGTTSSTLYIDKNVTAGTTYYYIVTAIVNGVESDHSNEASATPTAPVVSGNPGILEITMVTGEIKEYDLTTTELQSFLTWYDGRSNGADKAYYMITKKNNIKPFLSRKEYISFDKISSFEVKEYTE